MAWAWWWGGFQAEKEAGLPFISPLFVPSWSSSEVGGGGVHILHVSEAHISFRQQPATERLPDFHGTYERTGATVWVKPNQIFGRITHLQPVRFGAPGCDACDLSQPASAWMLHDRTVRGDFITPRRAQGIFLFRSWSLSTAVKVSERNIQFKVKPKWEILTISAFKFEFTITKDSI